MSIEQKIAEQAAALQHDWDTNPRWEGITRDYTAEDVIRLRGSIQRSIRWLVKAPSVLAS